MPLLIPLCVTSGAALAYAVDRLRARRIGTLLGPAAAVGMAAMVANWNLGLDDGVGGEQTRRAIWLIETGQHEDARRYVDRIAARHPTRGVLHFRAGNAFATAGRLDDAISQFREALQIDRGQPAIHLELGQALVAADRAKEAVPHLHAALDAGFRPDLAAPWLVRALASSGERDRAVKLLGALPDEAGAARAETAFDLGTLALDLNAPHHAERWLRIAVAGAPNHADAHLNLAVTYAQGGRLADARRHAEEALRLDPQEPRTRELLKALQKD